MIKVHNITGLRYLCQTKQNDPYKYLGSGTDWKHHLSQFGRNVSTTIISSSSNKTLINELGRKLSKEWRITSSVDDFGNKIWANRIDETGAGGGLTSVQAKQRFLDHPELISKFKAVMSSSEVANKRKLTRKKTVNTSEYKTKFKNLMRLVANRPEVKLQNSISQKIAQNRPDIKLKKSITQKIAQNRPEVKLRKQISGKIAQNKPEVKASKTGKNHYRYDPTILTFTHKDGTVEKMPANDFSIKYNLDRGWLSNVIRGRRNSIKGWTITR
jgi:hypothetical protein